MTAGELEPLKTLADLPFFVLGRHPKPRFVGRCHGETVAWLSTREFFDRVRDVALGLATFGLAPGDRIGLASESRPEWLVVDLAAHTIGLVVVPVYPTLTAAQAGAVLADAGARLAVVADRQQLDKLVEARRRAPSLESFVIMDPGAADGGVPSLDEVAARGHARIVGGWGAAKAHQDAARRVGPEDLATFIYTSGTTGEAKGVMLTHANIVSNVKAGIAVLPMSSDDVALSFLPLSHAFERTVVYAYLTAGVSVAFAERLDSLARDVVTVRPTLMTGVPRVFEKVHARVHETAGRKSRVEQALFRWAIGVAGRWADRALGPAGAGRAEPKPLAWRIADRLVFEKIRERMGGRLRAMVSGSAALPPAIGRFFFGVGLPVIEGYGLTETAPILTVNPFDRPRLGTVGPALPGVELRIDEDGEIMARGPNVMRGYHNRPTETAAVLSDGWFRTGDVGRLDPDGFLSITDRKKDLLVTSGGKKIAPQPIENVLKRDPLVAEAVLLGERRRFPAVLLVPDFAMLELRLGAAGTSREQLVGRPDAVAAYEAIVERVNQGLAQFERIKKFAVLPEEFSIERGELTPTMKVRRRAVEQRWHDVIEAMYVEPPEEHPS